MTPCKTALLNKGFIGLYRDIIPIMQSQLKKHMQHDMNTGRLQGHIGFRFTCGWIANNQRVEANKENSIFLGNYRI